MTTAADLTADFLNIALSPLLDGARVLAVEAVPVGTGQMGDCVRLTATYDRPSAAPPTLVAKLPAADSTSRATALALRNYEIEVSFYKELAGDLGVRTPHCYYATVDPATADFVLLLEDVAPCTQGDQLTGCTGDQAAIAVAELPGLHAPRWGDRSLEKLTWLHRGGGGDGAEAPEQSMLGAMMEVWWPGFCTRYDGRIDPDIVELGEQMVVGLNGYTAARPGPSTVQHGDYRLDNLLFGTADGGPPVVVVDWQTVSYGPGVSDLSYFIGAGLQVDDRRAHEADLVRLYQDGMRAAGVVLDWDDLWAQYRRYTFAGLIMAIAASMLVEQTDRGDDMFVTMAQRHGRHALDMEAMAFLGQS